MRIPSPDYDSHSAYGGMLSPSWKTRITALRKVTPPLLSLWWKDALLSLKRKPSAGKASPALEREGITTFRIPEEQKKKLLALLEEDIRALREKRTKIAPAKRGVENCVTRIADPRNPTHEVLLLVEAILTELGIFEIGRAYHGFDLRIKAVNLQINDAQDGGIANVFPDLKAAPPSTYYAHIDSTLGTLKVLIYLTDVKKENGPFRYFVGSHRLEMGRFERCLRKACDLAGLDSTRKEARELFLAMPKPLRKKANFGNDLTNDSPEARALLAKERAVTSDAGDLILFDNNGIHRGAIFEAGERQMLQISLVPRS